MHRITAVVFIQLSLILIQTQEETGKDLPETLKFLFFVFIQSHVNRIPTILWGRPSTVEGKQTSSRFKA